MLIKFSVTSLLKKLADYDQTAILPVCSTRGTSLEYLTVKRAMNSKENQRFSPQNQLIQG
jgi:hypothetical protein